MDNRGNPHEDVPPTASGGSRSQTYETLVRNLTHCKTPAPGSTARNRATLNMML
jgi:hypothetical protein